ncbi:MAG: GNAT family N-acetyltransferase [Veillonellaceae bacterium]|nr:GNAT family N-acetyltransferase [Veillonellaceae bacterium]
MIRQARETDRATLEALWDYCFEKRDEPFFQFYFAECFRPEEAWVYETAAGIAAAVHLRRYELVVRGALCPVTYIVGLATHPAARGRGYANELLRAALAEGDRLGRHANILMPSAAGFYQPQGWELYAHLWRREADLRGFPRFSAPNISYEVLGSAADTTAPAQIYAAYTRDLSGYARRDAAYWRRWLRGQQAEGQVVVAYEGATPVAYMAYALSGDTLVAGEWLATNATGERALLAYVGRHGGSVQKAIWHTALADDSYRYWPDGAEQTYITNRTLPFMTIRPSDVRAWTAQIPVAAAGEIALTVTSPTAQPVHFAVAAETAGLPLVREAAAGAAELSCGDLGALQLGAVSVASLLRAERLRGEPEALAQLAAFYPPVPTFINEWY